MKYRKKSVVVEAVQLTKELALRYFNQPDNERVFRIFDKFDINGSYHLKDQTVADAYITIETLEGRMRCNLNDWVIKGINGEFYPCKPDIFEKTYELVEDK